MINENVKEWRRGGKFKMKMFKGPSINRLEVIASVMSRERRYTAAKRVAGRSISAFSYLRRTLFLCLFSPYCTQDAPCLVFMKVLGSAGVRWDEMRWDLGTQNISGHAPIRLKFPFPAITDKSLNKGLCVLTRQFFQYFPSITLNDGPATGYLRSIRLDKHVSPKPVSPRLQPAMFNMQRLLYCARDYDMFAYLLFLVYPKKFKFWSYLSGLPDDEYQW